MKRTAVLLLVVVLIMSLTPAAQAWMRPHWAQQWVRDHPFLVTSWLDDGSGTLIAGIDTGSPPANPFVQTYRNANLTYYGYCDPLDDEFLDAIETYEAANPGASKNPLWVWMSPNEGGLANLNDHDNNNGNPGVVFMNRDEPNTLEKLIGASSQLQWLKLQYPGWLSFTNAIGSEVWRDGVNVGVSQDFVDYNEPDILCSDYYPFRQGDWGAAHPEINQWLDYLATLREVGLANGLPYQTWITSEAREGDVGLNSRIPSESDFRMQYFSALAYGFKGFVSMSYIDTPGGTNDVLAEAMGMSHTRPLEATVTRDECKIVTFVPPDELSQIANAAFAAGAGALPLAKSVGSRVASAFLPDTLEELGPLQSAFDPVSVSKSRDTV